MNADLLFLIALAIFYVIRKIGEARVQQKNPDEPPGSEIDAPVRAAHEQIADILGLPELHFRVEEEPVPEAKNSPESSAFHPGEFKQSGRDAFQNEWKGSVGFKDNDEWNDNVELKDTNEWQTQANRAWSDQATDYSFHDAASAHSHDGTVPPITIPDLSKPLVVKVDTKGSSTAAKWRRRLATEQGFKDAFVLATILSEPLSRRIQSARRPLS